MLDPQRFLRGTVVSGPEQLAPVMVRRLKSDLTALGTEGFPTRRLVQIDLVHGGSSWQARTLREDQPAATRELGGGEAVEVQLSALLARYTELACPAKGRGRLVFINLQKRLLSSVEAFARTLEKHALSVGASRLDLEGAPELDLEDGISSDVEDERMERQVAAATTALPAPEKEAAQLLEQLRRLAQRHRSSADAKARALIAWIREHLCPAASLDEAPRGASKGWTARRLIVFTEYGHTKTYLRKLLESAIEGTDRAQDRIRVFDGGMSEDNRALLQEEFNGDPNAYPVRILIATDAAREGVNLQGYCSDLFHYDIPWNPGRLEQRNGRIDRTLAFEDEVRCHYFFYPQRAEDEVLRAVVRKVGQIQHDLGSVQWCSTASPTRWSAPAFNVPCSASSSRRNSASVPPAAPRRSWKKLAPRASTGRSSKPSACSTNPRSCSTSTRSCCARRSMSAWRGPVPRRSHRRYHQRKSLSWWRVLAVAAAVPAKGRAHDAESLLHRRGRDESRALAKIIQAQIRLADKTIDQQLSFEFSDAEREQREQRERDRKHRRAQREAISGHILESGSDEVRRALLLGVARSRGFLATLWMRKLGPVWSIAPELWLVMRWRLFA